MNQWNVVADACRLCGRKLSVDKKLQCGKGPLIDVKVLPDELGQNVHEIHYDTMQVRK